MSFVALFGNDIFTLKHVKKLMVNHFLLTMLL